MDNEFLNQIVGEKLSAVVFVMDYIQLQFDGFVLTILNPITVFDKGISVVSGNTQFRNLLCDQITKVVKTIECRENEGLIVEFEDSAKISVSLKPEQYSGSEAVIFQSLGNVWDVI